MDLVDRLRPRWRHPDGEVRAAAVRDMGVGDEERLETLARTDPDARVRRIAIRKVERPDVLDAVAAGDADPALAELAATRARELRVAIAASTGPITEREAALARLADDRSLLAVAAAGDDDEVARAALARIAGDRALRDVVRSRAHPAIREAALARIGDAGVLRSIATADVPAELALAAVERIDDAEALRAVVETRTASKAVRRRARERLPAGVEAAAVGHKEARARQLALCTLVESLTAEADVLMAANRVRTAEEEWRAIARDVAPRDDVGARFASACAAILDDAASVARREAAADHERIAIEEGLAARRTLCERVETLDGPEAARELDEARGAWDRLPPLVEGRAAELARRFARAVAACGERDARRRTVETVGAGLEALVVEAEALAGSTPPPRPKAWHALERRWADLRRAEVDPERGEILARRCAQAGERLAARRPAAEARAEADRGRHLAQLQGLEARAHEAAAAESLKPGAARRDLAAIEAALAELPALPAAERRADWLARLGEARDQLLRRVRQAEETEEWRRWANVAAQEEIIARVEALLAANDLAEGTKQLGRLQDEWAAVASASPDKSQALWERFRTARNELRRRCDAYMAENLEKKRALCAQVAEIGESTSWQETTALVKRVQEEWKAVGPVPARHAQALWQQFREPCDRFFARRKAHFERVDGERRQVVERKQALCERAEALADSTDWEATTAVMKQLQAEWKASGGLPRAQGDALWHRFRTACDRFFDRRGRREEIEREALVARGRALCETAEALAAGFDGPDAPAPDAAGRTLDDAWAEWVRLDLPASDEVRGLEARLGEACARIASACPESLRGTRLDPETTRKRREKLCARVEALAGRPAEAPRVQSLQEMALALRERLATNTIAGGGSGGGRAQELARELERIDAGWGHLGPALDDASRALTARFEAARARLGRRAR